MKALKIIFITFLVLFILLFVGLFIFVKTFDVNKYLPQITRQIGAAINRKVNIDRAQLGFGLKGLSLQLKNLTISDDPQFGSKDFLDLQEAYVGLDLMALVEKRQVSVTKIILESPKISIVRLSNGTLNVQTMAPAASKQAANPAAVTAPAASASAAPAPAAMGALAVFIKSVEVNHLQVSVEDNNPQMPLHMTIPDGNVRINDFSLTDPFDFTAHLNAWGRGNNINISGHCRLDLMKTAVSITGLQVKSDFSQWDLDQLKSLTPALGTLPLAQEIKGDVTVDVPELTLTPQGLQGLYLQVKANIGEGTVDAKADVKEFTSTPAYNFQLQAKSVKIEDLVDESKMPVGIKGTADLQFTGSGESFEPQAMQSNLKGDGKLALNNSEIDKLNVLKAVLDKLNFIPGLSGLVGNAVDTALPADIKSQLDTDTTVLDKAEAKIKVENKTISLEDAQVASKLFSIGAQGTVDFDLNTNIDVKTYVASNLSTALTKKAKPMQGLLDEQGRLYIPGKVTGKIPSVGYQPQLDYITKKIAVAEGGQQISTQLQKVFKKNPGVANILNAVLGGGQGQSQNDQSQNGDDTSSNSDQSTNAQTQPSQGDNTKKLINGLLGKILQ